MPAHLNIVVVEDHDLLRQTTVDILCQQGHRAIGVVCAEEVDDLSDAVVPDLYIIDLNLPGENGLSLARRIRSNHSRVGIIMVTARSQLTDKIAGYDSGADLYLAKPVDTQELIAAIDALGRRLKPAELNISSLVSLEVQRLLLSGPDGQIELTQTEAALLSALAKAPGQLLARWQAAASLGQTEDNFSESSMEVRIARARKKLAEVGAPQPSIKAIRNLGYKLCIPLKVI